MDTNFFFSPANNSFYPADLLTRYKAAGTLPDDLKGVSDEIFQEFTQTPPPGKMRITGEDGLPTWGDIPPPSRDEQIAAAELKKQSLISQANDYMNSRQWPGKAAIGLLKGDELSQYKLWLDYLDKLLAVDPSSAPEINWPPMPEM